MEKVCTKKGVSFLEVIVSIFIFLIIIGASSSLFISAVRGKRDTIETQKDLERAQQAVNFIAKTLRTSTVVSPTTSGFFWDVQVFDHSQAKCLRFRLSGGVVEVAENPSASDVPACRASTPANFTQMTSGTVAGLFAVFPYSPSVSAGKIIIRLEVCPSSGCAAGDDSAKIQTTVSLRDYEESI